MSTQQIAEIFTPINDRSLFKRMECFYIFHQLSLRFVPIASKKENWKLRR
jgi:hypothetical protein